MRTVEICGAAGRSKVFIGERLENSKRYIPTGRLVIITDTNVNRIYGKTFPAGEVIEIPSGEKIKTLDTVQKIYGQLMQLSADRSVFITGIGGGIVCDITGFVASTYLRGVRFGFVATSLLAQVDASVGGKNGVNFQGYKNMVGCFNQPEFVLCDMHMLKTLPKREILCGFGEIAKHAFIGDAKLVDFIEQNVKKALALDEDVIAKLVYESVCIKSSIVNTDEKEKGERKKLNFGHTVGHAIEKTTDELLHGEAVSVGMVVAANLSCKRGLLSTRDAQRVAGLLAKFGLPTFLKMEPEKIVDAAKKDKKRFGDYLDFVLLKKLGMAVLEKIHIKELEVVLGGESF